MEALNIGIAYTVRNDLVFLYPYSMGKNPGMSQDVKPKCLKVNGGHVCQIESCSIVKNILLSHENDKMTLGSMNVYKGRFL